jgi:hypothetical protein
VLSLWMRNTRYGLKTLGMDEVCRKCPIQKVTEIYNKVTEPYNFVTEFENSSWNILCLFRSEEAYNGTGHILL